MPSSSSSCDNTKQPTRLGGSSSAGGSCDENTPSVLDVNLDAKKISLAAATHNGSRLSSPVRFGDERKYGNNHNHHQHHHHHHHHGGPGGHHHIEVYSDGAPGLDNSKLEEEISEDDRGPPLPPRPAPRARTAQRLEAASSTSGVRKYVIWCLICGGISSLLGVLFLGIYFLLRSYTSTVGYFETVPTFVPATLLMLTGICIMSLARRRNRYSYLIKLSGACGLASALTCALVTVTTTVLHMSRLQVLRECEYTQKTRTCTCYSVTADKQTESGVDDSVRFVFDSTSDCGVVHGALYSCLRAVFGLSVAGVLVAVFSCMLVYQLLSHERKKMYWEQLELRCRSLYSGQQGPPSSSSVLPSGPGMLGMGGGGGGGVGSGRVGNCRCCEQCHAHRNVLPSAAYPWEGDSRFWTPGQAGNFYSPNPGGEDGPGTGGRGLSGGGRRIPGWSWPRMPWQRSDASQRLSPHSPDSQYGFSNRAGVTPVGPPGGGTLLGDPTLGQPRYDVIEQQYGIWGPPPPYSDPNSPARRGRYQYIHPTQCGPPLLDPNQTMGSAMVGPNAGGGPAIAILECHSQHSVMGVDVHGIPQQYVSNQATGPGQQPPLPPSSYSRGGGVGVGVGSSGVGRDGSTPNTKRHQTQAGYDGKGQSQAKENYEQTPSDSDGPGRDRFSNTLPLRKAKKRVEAGAKSIGPGNNGQPTAGGRVNVQHVFSGNQPGGMSGSLETSENEYNEPNLPPSALEECSGRGASPRGGSHGARSSRRQKLPPNVSAGIENGGFQTVEALEAEQAGVTGKLLEPTESEVYFADVSSCCNMSAVLGLGDKPPVMPRSSLIPKDHSRQSMCSVDSGERTDYTDLSPATPSTNFPSLGGKQQPPSEVPATGHPEHDAPTTGGCNFIASYPYSSNEQSQEAHRRSTKNLHDIFLAPDSQYEDMPGPFPQPPATGSSGPNDRTDRTTTVAAAAATSSSSKPKSPKNLNITPIKRQSLGTNISSIIQNLSGSDVGLLYPEGRQLHHHGPYHQGAVGSDGSSSNGEGSAGLVPVGGRRPAPDVNDSVSSNEDNEDHPGIDGERRRGPGDRRL
uniref:Uncharacterized protein n=1 Tax=Anopheles farauti TaxID=69004 RepID=A0A182Q8V6_9DIPT